MTATTTTFLLALIHTSLTITTASSIHQCQLDSYNPQTLKIHLVPHTHDDVGWLKTVDQYFYGLNNTIQQAHVSLILDNTLHALLDPSTPHNRTFTYVETSFFSKWYLSLSPSSQSSLQTLISRNQYSFANGGWCMHDEATTHYIGMIDQTSLGHDFLHQELNVIPRVAWQIDPFGHSKTQAALLTAEMGMDSIFFGRMHYMELERRQMDGECEGLWETTSTSTSTSTTTLSNTASDASSSESIFWGLSGSFSGNYGAPQGFCFDVLCDDDPLVGLDEMALENRIRNFLNLIKEQAGRTKGSNVMLTMGMDFQYSQARKNYQNLDLLIDATLHYIEKGIINVNDVFEGAFDNVDIFYSNPEIYTDCKYIDLVHSTSLDRQPFTSDVIQRSTEQDNVQAPIISSEQPTWKVKKGDWFPYADCDHCYWTGYFSSRQGLKRLERVGSFFLLASRQIQSIRELNGRKRTRSFLDGKQLKSDSNVVESDLIPKLKTWNTSPLYQLDDAMGVAQHHDAVAGTSKQHVAYDYAKRISSGMSSASAFVTQSLRELLLDDDSLSQGLLDNLSYCHLLNETICPVSQAASLDGTQTMHIVVYNALSSNRVEVISIPVNDANATYSVERLVNLPNHWQEVLSGLIPNHNYARIRNAAPAILYFEANELPPAGASIFKVSKVKVEDVQGSLETDEVFLKDASVETFNKATARLRARELHTEGDLVISNGLISVHCDRSSGVIKKIIDESTGINVEVEQNYGYYEAFSNSEFPKDMTVDTSTYNVKGNGMCIPGYTDSEGNEMPWLLGSADQWQNGGAYIFRTADTDLHIIPPKITSVNVYESDLVSEVHAEFEADGQPLIKQITRLLKDKTYVEVEYVVSPVPIDDGVGKEIISRFSTNINSGSTFFTDSNGREFMERTRGDNKLYGHSEKDPVAMEPVAGNYYPVNSAIYIEEDDRSFGVLVDRSQGASSLSDGSIELMIQRRLLQDDARGVSEALNETDIGITPNPPYGDATRLGEGIVIKGVHRLSIGQRGAEKARSIMDESFSQPLVFVASTPADRGIQFQQSRISALESSLPSNVMLITYLWRKAGTYLIRLAHQYAPNESVEHSNPVEIDLSLLFPPLKTIVSISEKTLSGNQNRADWEERKLQWDVASGQSTKGSYTKTQILDTDHVIVLQPLQIRTFEIQVA